VEGANAENGLVSLVNLRLAVGSLVIFWQRGSPRAIPPPISGDECPSRYTAALRDSLGLRTGNVFERYTSWCRACWLRFGHIPSILPHARWRTMIGENRSMWISPAAAAYRDT